MRSVILALLALGLLAGHAAAQLTPPSRSSETTPGDKQLTDYLRAETTRLAARARSEMTTAPSPADRRERRRQLSEMLGLWPAPARTELHPMVTGKLDGDGFSVEKVAFQASPGLYCTANLYLPTGLARPAPTILYRCGHWKYVTNGISMGNKAVYQFDGAWYARNGYVCLVLDTLLGGEIQGMHTGTRDHGLWWWNARGYTPAGVEAWFGIRALDYLCSRSEVDTNRFGATGHSGGGAYSWALAALDDRVQAVAPLAGVTDVRHHILDNLMDSHCDCNFWINTYQWDFPQLATLVVPRPLLIGGTDADRIFPLDSTISIHAAARQLYGEVGAVDRLGLAIAPGPHDEVPELRLAVLRWFNRHLRGLDKAAEPPVRVDARRWFAPEQLRVFETLPTNAVNGSIADDFVPPAPPGRRSAEALRRALRDTVFNAWPRTDPAPRPDALFATDREGLRLSGWSFLSQSNVPLRIYLLQRTDAPAPNGIQVRVLDEGDWMAWLRSVSEVFPEALAEERAAAEGTGAATAESTASMDRFTNGPGPWAFVAPRGLGWAAWSGDEKRRAKIRRRFMLLGQTVDGMRVWDIRRAIQALQSIPGAASLPLTLEAEGDMAVNALYAALYEPNIRELRLSRVPASHRTGPDYPGVLKITDIPEVLDAVSAEARLSLGD